MKNTMKTKLLKIKYISIFISKLKQYTNPYKMKKCL